MTQYLERRKAVGGVFVPVKNDINSSDCTFEDLTDNNCEIVWAQIRLPGSKLLNIASIYRPPNSNLQMMNKPATRQGKHSVSKKQVTQSLCLCVGSIFIFQVTAVICLYE